MEIRPTTDQEFDVFVDTLHAAFGRFPETRAEGAERSPHCLHWF